MRFTKAMFKVLSLTTLLLSASLLCAAQGISGAQHRGKTTPHTKTYELVQALNKKEIRHHQKAYRTTLDSMKFNFEGENGTTYYSSHYQYDNQMQISEAISYRGSSPEELARYATDTYSFLNTQLVYTTSEDSNKDSAAFSYLDNQLIAIEDYERVHENPEKPDDVDSIFYQNGKVCCISHYQSYNSEDLVLVGIDTVLYQGTNLGQIKYYSNQSDSLRLSRYTDYVYNANNLKIQETQYNRDWQTDSVYKSTYISTGYDGNNHFTADTVIYYFPSGEIDLGYLELYSYLAPNKLELLAKQYNTAENQWELDAKMEIVYNTDYTYSDVASEITQVYPYTEFSFSLDGNYYEPWLYRFAPLSYEAYEFSDSTLEWKQVETGNFYYSGMVNIEEKDPSLEITFYPNPGNDQIQFQLPKGTPASVTITDMRGTVVMDAAVVGSDKVDISQLPQGHYIATIKTPNTSQSYRLVVE